MGDREPPPCPGEPATEDPAGERCRIVGDALRDDAWREAGESVRFFPEAPLPLLICDPCNTVKVHHATYRHPQRAHPQVVAVCLCTRLLHLRWTTCMHACMHKADAQSLNAILL